MGRKSQTSAAAPTLTFVCVQTGSGDVLQVLPPDATSLRTALMVASCTSVLLLLVVQSLVGGSKQLPWSPVSGAKLMKLLNKYAFCGFVIVS